ncbi:MAG: glycosyltransferase [Labrys sp. (in: a-proteobacteria)]|jgi:glycosyltransferase involved in cell wall biosynthesis
MNVYFLPGMGIFGGIKVGFQFADALAAAGVRVAVATPDALAPTWLRSMTPPIDRDAALAGLRRDDVALFSLPQDYPVLKATPARLVFHCQGTASEIDAILADPTVTVLTCWDQARGYAKQHGRRSINVGIGISEAFFYDGMPKYRNTASFMPRRGAAIVADVARSLPGLDFVAIDGRHEDDAAHIMKRSLAYLATSIGEWFGLPALEAMAAGCVVVSVPVLGGREYLHPNHNCLVAEPADFPEVVKRLMSRDASALRDRLRRQAMATAAGYSLSRHRQAVARAVTSDLGKVLSWT